MCPILFRLGQLRVGDKILAINGISLEGVTLHTAIKLANEVKECIDMTVEFEVEGASFSAVNTIHVLTLQIPWSLMLVVWILSWSR